MKPPSPPPTVKLYAAVAKLFETSTTPEDALTQLLLAPARCKCVLSLGIGETFLHAVRICAFFFFLSFFRSLFTFGLGVSPPLTGAVFPTSPSNSKQVGSNTAICPGRQLRSSSRTKHSEPSGRRINEEHLLAVVEGREVQSDPDEASRSSCFTRPLDFFPPFSHRLHRFL